MISSNIQLTPEDLKQLASKNITTEQIARQIECFEQGFDFLEIIAPATTGKGIRQLDENDCRKYAEAWENYRQTGKKILKFVPASGAASRMFKDLFAFIESAESEPKTAFEQTFFNRIRDFAFFEALDKACKSNTGKGADELIDGKQYKTVAKTLLSTEGLNYGNLPKAMLHFHDYGTEVRTPFEEHLAEGEAYAKEASGKVNVHFTVSHEHRQLFEQLSKEKTEKYAKRYSTAFEVTFSEQKPSTDTIAADMQNKPFRTADGKLLFRPAGHGALIENLNDLDYDIIFIKNIDNIVPDALKGDTITYKKAIAGLLITLQQKTYDCLETLERGNCTTAQLKGMLAFLENELCCHNDEAREYGDEKLARYIQGKLNRPIRVCGMVKNEGEPGGGPFFAYNSDGTVSLQILESSQIDMNDPGKKTMFENSTHFNPVDLVCAVKDHKGLKYNLIAHVDSNTGFISTKSKDGKELKALELPGLWNGAMSDWNTVFVEVPSTTFNPVKTVNDLLRPQHQKQNPASGKATQDTQSGI